jgi:2-dehydro-3-deoxyphosphooctonate aldolase (KDO 8-P synthase)|tara:strand:+ start:331 stop:1077 length:747 start_codon:yes stop_codon:yes gene_type:complete
MENYTYILGPCSIENLENFLTVAKTLDGYMGGKDWYLKGSFDKANRTSIHSDRGPGLDEGIRIMQTVKRLYPNVKIVTDIHEVNQALPLSDVVDVIQIPAFLCRQTDLLVECARHFDVINIKKGQWLSAESMKHAVNKIKEVDPNCKVWITERGSQFGYDRLIVDFRGVDVMKEFADKVILDCTHSTQITGDGITGGSRKLAKQYAQAARIFEYDGVFIETHPNPDNAISDSDSQVELDWLVTQINII